MNKQQIDTKKWFASRLGKPQAQQGTEQKPITKWLDAPTMGHIPKRCLCCGGVNVNHD